MATLIGQATSLLKLRIGVAIAASALAGMAATKGPALSPAQVIAFALAVLGGAGAAGAFNHYYERDLDVRMARTRQRPCEARAWSERRAPRARGSPRRSRLSRPTDAFAR